MKNFIFVFGLILIALHSNIYAQFVDDYGIKIGATNSSINYNNLLSDYLFNDQNGNQISVPKESNSNKFIAPTFSLYIRKAIGDYFIIEPELSFIQKGGCFERDDSRFGIHVYDSLDDFYKDMARYYSSFPQSEPINSKTFTYLSFTINSLVGYSINCVRPYLILGPQINYLVRGDYFYDMEYKKLLFGYNLGLGIEIDNLLKEKLLFEICYNADFSPFAKNGLVKVYNRTWKMVFGIRL